MGFLTLSELSQAMQEKLGLAGDAADSNAEYVLDLFGFDTQIIDNVLEPEDRQLFYMLQEEGLLSTKSEETALWNGQAWRTHYWLIREERVLDLASRAAEKAQQAAAPTAGNVYSDLPDSVWSRT